MLIMILFHDSGYRCLKHFYKDQVCRHLSHLFPRTVSYNRFVEQEKDIAVPLAILKNIAQVEHSRHRSFENFVVNLFGAIASYCFFPKKPCINIVKVTDNQLTLF